MRHPTTGEVVQVTLDALPLALGSGFVPELWAEGGRRVLTPGGAVLTVLDGAGLPELEAISPPQAQLIAKRDEVQARLRMALDEQERTRLSTTGAIWMTRFGIALRWPQPPPISGYTSPLRCRSSGHLCCLPPRPR